MTEIVPVAPSEVLAREAVPALLQSIRPAWRGRDLVARVERLLPVDASSACQRVFNAAMHDLREKVVIAGIDIAKAVASAHRLPPVERAEDIEEHYSTAKLLDLAYRMGLLTRPEWRRLSRAYEIRRDLEHEDNEYEADFPGCLYIFGACIDVVLARDPMSLIKVLDVKQIVQEPNPATPDATLSEDFANAPDPRQEEILQFLVSTALDDTQPDVIRQNSYVALNMLSTLARDSVRIEVAKSFQARIGRVLDERHARVAHAAGAMPYLRRAARAQFFADFRRDLVAAGHHFRSHEKHGDLLRTLTEVGSLRHIPASVRPVIVKWMVLCYIGEPGGYGAFGRNRPVFYSNPAADPIRELLNIDVIGGSTPPREIPQGAGRPSTVRRDRRVPRSGA
jgi:hypothetical protein